MWGKSTSQPSRMHIRRNLLDMLQVLISIQSMILVDDPFFNEPGYESSRATAHGRQANENYNKEQQMNTLAHAILPALKQPDPCFAEIIR